MAADCRHASTNPNTESLHRRMVSRRYRKRISGNADGVHARTNEYDDINVMSRQKRINKNREPLASNFGFLGLIPTGLVPMLVCFDILSPRLGYPQRLSDEVVRLFARKSRTPRSGWVLHDIVVNGTTGSLEVCYETRGKKRLAKMFLEGMWDYILEKGPRGLKGELVREFDVRGMAFSVRRYEEWFEEGGFYYEGVSGGDNGDGEVRVLSRKYDKPIADQFGSLPPTDPLGDDLRTLVCFDLLSPKLGFPQEMADDIRDLYVAESGKSEDEWAFHIVDLNETSSKMEVCYETIVKKKDEEEFLLRMWDYIVDEKKGGLKDDLDRIKGYNVKGMVFTVRAYEFEPLDEVTDEGLEGNPNGQNALEGTPAPGNPSSRRGSSVTKIVASLVGLVSVIAIATVIILLVQRDGVPGNHRRTFLRRRNFLRWVDRAEEERQNDFDEESHVVSTEVDVEDLPSNFSQGVVTDDAWPSSRYVSSNFPLSSTDLNMGSNNYERDMNIRR